MYRLVHKKVLVYSHGVQTQKENQRKGKKNLRRVYRVSLPFYDKVTRDKGDAYQEVAHCCVRSHRQSFYRVLFFFYSRKQKKVFVLQKEREKSGDWRLRFALPEKEH